MISCFISQNWKHVVLPCEDSFSIDEANGIIAVADGVTRDPVEYLPNLSTLSGKAKFAFNYPRPSPAADAADAFANYVTFYLTGFNKKDEQSIRIATKLTNLSIIKKINDQVGITIGKTDYLKKDYAGCVAAVAVKNRNYVHFGFICDSGIAIFDEKGNLKFQTPDESPHRLESIMWQDPIIAGKTWNQPEVRVRIRSHYRNNPSNPNSYGVLTGEDEAIHYFRTGTQEIKSGETLIAYTDGLEKILHLGEFSDLIRQKNLKGIKRLAKKHVKTEGTMVISV